MFNTLPHAVDSFMDWEWSQIQPYIENLLTRELTPDSIQAWLADWTTLSNLLSERFTRLQVATTVNTKDTEAETRLKSYLDTIYPHAIASSQQLAEKLVTSGLSAKDFDIPLRNIRAQVEIFNKANIPLFTELHKLGQEYDKIVGDQTVDWNGEERTIRQLNPILQEQDRAIREQVWHLASQRQLQDREALNGLWAKLLTIRRQIAENAGFSNYRDYQWKAMQRFDYTPDDCFAFHEAIEKAVVPAAQRIYERRRQQLGVEALRPWDLSVDPKGLAPLRPFNEVSQLEKRCATIFENVDPELGAYYHIMQQERLLDLDNRKGKAPGGYCTSFPIKNQPFIFMNAVGIHDDVQTMLHESGHAFHVFESAQWPYFQQMDVPMEFAEVASMAMELLAAPYLNDTHGGFYNNADSARARVEHLTEIITFWPYMAVVDAFQHWVYDDPDRAMNPANCDAQWGSLWDRFMKGIDWSGLDNEKVTGWHRKLHIFQVPFYYIEYGLAQLGAVQVWKNALSDQAAALQSYRHALSMGGTRTLPELYQAAGAKFTVETETLAEAVALVEETIVELEA
ncbi:MAG: M3 family oligoendopeptidase [Anaerolineales bacterium]|nr:M3 family oligoendopeptidase [Anaerolineales bacterium]